MGAQSPPPLAGRASRVNQFDLHRPYIDDITLVSPSGRPVRRETHDLIDVWFDSGSMPYAPVALPFENQEVFKIISPADFIAEMDQTRGWFYTLHAIATMCYDSVAFKNVVSNGLVLDKEGNKMSKSKGNVVDPFETIAEYGTRRHALVYDEQCALEGFKFTNLQVSSKLCSSGTLFNTYNFFALYANLDGFKMDSASFHETQRTGPLDHLQTLLARERSAHEPWTT